MQWTHNYRSLLVFGSFVCALVVMYADVTGTIVTLQVLYGVDATKRPGDDYYASTIPRFVHMNILNQTRKLHELQDQRVLYVEPSDTDPTDYFIVPDNCISLGYQASDILYNESYALPLVQRILDGLNTSINLTATPMTHALMVDCDYSGRHFQDTTVFKVFLVDSSLTLMWSIAVQTMAAMRETTRLEAAVGVAIVSQAEFAKFGVGPDDPPDAPWSFGLTYDGTSNYRTLVSINFPYEVETPFFETYRDGILPSHEYAWRIQSTNESLTIAGRSGYYRGSKNSQMNNAVFVLDMSGDPIRDIVVDAYPAMPFTKDSRAWIQGLVIMTIGVRIGFTIAVALNIALTTLMSKRQACLPDVFPTIKHHIRFRSVFLVLAFVGDGFWSLQEWALSAGYNRYHLLPMFIVKDNIRSDFLMLFLVWTDVVASILRVGIWPAIPVVVYMVCYAYSDTLVVSLTSSAVDQETSDYCLQGFLQNIVAYSMTGMNKWDQYELSPDDPPSWLVAREFVWFFAPCLGMTCALILYK
ncbi:unnamed protein product, partial [Aphanomyces euteiches]